MKQCEWCYNYNKPSCPLFSFSELDRLKTRMYIVDCWCDKDDFILCQLECGMEDDEK